MWKVSQALRKSPLVIVIMGLFREFLPGMGVALGERERKNLSLTEAR